MPKIPVHQFHLPLIQLTRQPYQQHEDEKLFWVDFKYIGSEFPLENLAILENGRTLKVKHVQRGLSAHQMQFKGIPEKALVPDMRLYDARWPISWERKAYFVPLGAQNQKLELDKATMTGELLDSEGLEVNLRKIAAGESKFLLNVQSNRRFPCLIGAVYHFELGGTQALDAVLVTSGILESKDLNDFIKKTYRFPGLPSVNALYSINLRVHGWVVLPPALYEDVFEEADGTESVRVMTKAYTNLTKKIINSSMKPGGIALSALNEKMALPAVVFDYLVEKLVKEGKIKESEGWVIPSGDPTHYLSPLAKNVLGKLEELGLQGFDPSQESNPVLVRAFDDLARMGLAVKTESPWFYSMKAWDVLKHKICGPGSLGKAWKISEVKEVLDCSRKPLLGTLNKLEAEGFLEWKEDVRIVLKTVD